jgi:hypothetical protein
MGFPYGGYRRPAAHFASATPSLTAFAYPYRTYRNQDNEEQYYSDAQVEMIAKSREARFNGKYAAQRLPRVRTALNTLYLSRLGQNELKKLVAFLPTGELQEGLAGAVQLAGAAYKAGLAVACNLDSGAGWDHHGDVDVNVANSLGRLFSATAASPVAPGSSPTSTTARCLAHRHLRLRPHGGMNGKGSSPASRRHHRWPRAAGVTWLAPSAATHDSPCPRAERDAPPAGILSSDAAKQAPTTESVDGS